MKTEPPSDSAAAALTAAVNGHATDAAQTDSMSAEAPVTQTASVQQAAHANSATDPAQTDNPAATTAHAIPAAAASVIRDRPPVHLPAVNGHSAAAGADGSHHNGISNSPVQNGQSSSDSLQTNHATVTNGVSEDHAVHAGSNGVADMSHVNGHVLAPNGVANDSNSPLPSESQTNGHALHGYVNGHLSEHATAAAAAAATVAEAALGMSSGSVGVTNQQVDGLTAQQQTGAVVSEQQNGCVVSEQQNGTVTAKQAGAVKSQQQQQAGIVTPKQQLETVLSQPTQSDPNAIDISDSDADGVDAERDRAFMQSGYMQSGYGTDTDDSSDQLTNPEEIGIDEEEEDEGRGMNPEEISIDEEEGAGPDPTLKPPEPMNLDPPPIGVPVTVVNPGRGQTPTTPLGSQLTPEEEEDDSQVKTDALAFLAMDEDSDEDQVRPPRGQVQLCLLSVLQNCCGTTLLFACMLSLSNDTVFFKPMHIAHRTAVFSNNNICCPCNPCLLAKLS